GAKRASARAPGPRNSVTGRGYNRPNRVVARPRVGFRAQPYDSSQCIDRGDVQDARRTDHRPFRTRALDIGPSRQDRMCTVSIVALNEPGNRRLRLACNRDELRSRPAALPPLVRNCDERQAIMPIDPVSDGTWIAVNDAGIAATLLNVNLATRD